ncbi:MAG: hypothetical protein ACP5D6_06415 [Kosmotogaceae bacterium]
MRNTIKHITPYTPIIVGRYAFLFLDSNQEIWCFSPDQQRVFHVAAEIQMMLEGFDPYETNGYSAATYLEACKEVSDNAGE